MNGCKYGKCDFCKAENETVKYISDGTDSGEGDHYCDACLNPEDRLKPEDFEQ